MQTISLQSALDQVDGMAFNLINRLKNAITRVHTLLTDPKHSEHHELLGTLLQLLTSAVSLRDDKVKGVADYVCAQINAGQPIDPSIIAGLKHHAVRPPKAVQDAVIKAEHIMAEGKYEDFLLEG